MENIKYTPEKIVAKSVEIVLSKKVSELFVPHELDGLGIDKNTREQTFEELLTEKNKDELLIAFKDRKSSLNTINEDQFFKDLLAVCLRVNKNK